MTKPLNPDVTPNHASRLSATKLGAPPKMTDEFSKSGDPLRLHAPGRPRINKTDAVIAMLQRADGASVEDIMAVTGWQRHSVRGAFAGAVKKKLGSAVTVELVDGMRRYRAPEAAA